MIKLTDILKEIINESNTIKIPDSELKKVDILFEFIKKNFNRLNQQVTTKKSTENNPIIFNTFKNYFTLIGYNKKPININVGFYYEPVSNVAGRMDTNSNTLLVPVSNEPPKNLNDFKETIEHELIHSIDPKTSNQDLFYREFNKKGASPNPDTDTYEKDLNKYLKSPWEFDAFTTPLINRIKKNLNKFKSKQVYLDLLNKFLYDLKTKDPNLLVSEENYNWIPFLLTNEEWNIKNIDDTDIDEVMEDYYNEVTKLKSWSTKPTLYKRFTQRLYKNI